MGSSLSPGCTTGTQLPCTQWSVNSSTQTNSQSSGVAGQAGEHVCLCAERMEKEKGEIGGLAAGKVRGHQGSLSHLALQKPSLAAICFLELI